jgi:hypothetical protein
MPEVTAQILPGRQTLPYRQSDGFGKVLAIAVFGRRLAERRCL